MSKKIQKTLFNILYIVFALLALTGAYLKLQHNPSGTTIIFIGFIPGQLLLIIDYQLLRKRVRELEKKNETKI